MTMQCLLWHWNVLWIRNDWLHNKNAFNANRGKAFWSWFLIGKKQKKDCGVLLMLGWHISFLQVQAFSAPAAVLKVIAHSVSCEVSHGIVVDKRGLTKQRWCWVLNAGGAWSLWFCVASSIKANFTVLIILTSEFSIEQGVHKKMIKHFKEKCFYILLEM